MISKALKVVGDEWQASLFFVAIILVLGALSLFVLKGTILKIILFCIGLDVYNGYFIFIANVLRGEPIENPYRSILFGKDKNRYDFYILIVFFGIILLLLRGPMILFQVLLSEKFNEFLASLGPGILVFNLLALLVYTAYKISIYSAVASLTYHKKEVLESFKTGIKGIWRFKYILITLAIIEIVLLLFMAIPIPAINNTTTLLFYIIPAMIMLLMSCNYDLAETSAIPAEESAGKNDDDSPNKGIE